MLSSGPLIIYGGRKIVILDDKKVVVIYLFPHILALRK